MKKFISNQKWSMYGTMYLQLRQRILVCVCVCCECERQREHLRSFAHERVTSHSVAFAAADAVTWTS